MKRIELVLFKGGNLENEIEANASIKIDIFR